MALLRSTHALYPAPKDPAGAVTGRRGFSLSHCKAASGNGEKAEIGSSNMKEITALRDFKNSTLRHMVELLGMILCRARSWT